MGGSKKVIIYMRLNYAFHLGFDALHKDFQIVCIAYNRLYYMRMWRLHDNLMGAALAAAPLLFM